MLVPVASRSKKASGRFKFNFIAYRQKVAKVAKRISTINLKII